MSWFTIITGIDFSRQNLTSVDVIDLVPELEGVYSCWKVHTIQEFHVLEYTQEYVSTLKPLIVTFTWYQRCWYIFFILGTRYLLDKNVKYCQFPSAGNKVPKFNIQPLNCVIC